MSHDGSESPSRTRTHVEDGTSSGGAGHALVVSPVREGADPPIPHAHGEQLRGVGDEDEDHYACARSVGGSGE